VLPTRIHHLGLQAVKNACYSKNHEYILFSLFPIYANNGTTVPVKKTYEFLNGKHGSLFAKLIHIEIKHKIETLTQLKIQQASGLSCMIQYPPFDLNERSSFKSMAAQIDLFLSRMNWMLTSIPNSTPNHIHTPCLSDDGIESSYIYY
jgi:hypothetical protein